MIADVIHKYQALPFRYGNDCCAFVGDCLAELTGKNPNYDYSTEAEAEALIEKHGGLEGAITSVLGPPIADTPRDGDVVLIDNGARQVAGIVYRNRLVCRVASGLVDLDLERAKRVWRYA